METTDKRLFPDVRKISMEETLPNFLHNTGLSHAVLVSTAAGDRIVNYCSEDYFLVKNEEILPPLITELRKFYKVDMKYRVYNHARFYIDLIIKDKELSMGSMDKIYGKIITVNSYDGSKRYHFEMGFWRKVCANGLMGFTGWDSVSHLHTPGITSITDFSAVMAMTAKFLEEADEHFERFRELASQPVRNPLLRIDEILDETDFPPSLAEDVVSRLEEERKILGTGQVTDWLIYNAFNYQLNHAEDYKAKEEKKAKIDSQVFQYLLNY
jgi:hypothetical protein